MARKVVFLGNCQALRYKELYTQTIAPSLGDEVSFVATFGALTDNVTTAIEGADVVAAQVYDGEANIGLHNVETAANVVLFPNVTGMFLWPFGAQPHPLNKPEEFLPHGPYDANMGDRWLNKKMRGHDLSTPEIERLADEYLALDLATESKADRLFELVIDRQRQRDAQSGFACADLIERHLHDEVVFHTPASFTLPLFRHLAEGLYGRLGAPKDVLKRTLDRLIHSPFSSTERPIHPSIAKFFDLRYFRSEQKYVFWTGEYLTLREYVIRYLRYDWNAQLLKGCIKAEHTHRYADRTDIEATIQILTTALRTSTGSARCERALSHLYALLGENESAFGAYCHAMILEPDDPNAVGHYSHLLMEKGRLAEAEHVLQSALSRWPQVPALWNRLGGMLAREGRIHEAAETMQLALTRHPEVEYICRFYGELQARLTRLHVAPAQSPS